MKPSPKFYQFKITNVELAFQNQEKQSRAAELMKANAELAFQNSEKEKRAEELLAANKELAFQNQEKEKRAKELIIANKELVFQNKEKEKKAEELVMAIKEKQITENELKEQSARLLKIAIMQSHQVRVPVANILGLVSLLDDDPSAVVNTDVIRMIKDAANTLDKAIFDIVQNTQEIRIILDKHLG